MYCLCVGICLSHFRFESYGQPIQLFTIEILRSIFHRFVSLVLRSIAAIVIKPSNIRIWIHDKDIGKLTQVVWEGQGNRLRTEISSNNRVKKFLDAVPYVMVCISIASIETANRNNRFRLPQNVVKEVHTCVIGNDLDGLKARSDPPVPKALLSCKDVNGLTPLHKASGLNRLEIVEYLLRMWPAAATESDATGKTPLHWAASPEIFNRLVQAGSDEQACDYVSFK